MQKVVQYFTNLKVGLRIFSFENDFMAFSINFNPTNHDSIPCEFTVVLSEDAFGFLVEFLESELQNFLFLQNLNMEMDHSVDAFNTSLHFLESVLA